MCRGPAVIKNEDLSCSVFSAMRKTIQGQLPCQNIDGIVEDPRFMWSRVKMKGVQKPVLMANCYLHCGQGLKDRNLHYLRVISRAADGGKQPVFGFGDFNVPAEVLRASGILEGLALEIIVPSNDEIACLAGKGSVIDYIVCTKGWKHLVFSC